ncbi:MAG: hypothetical protein AB1611_19745 [bacterium]
MRLVQGLWEIFYFPFYFVSLNVAGFMSFVRFVQGSQPPSWKKAARVAVEAEERQYGDEGMEYPKASSGRGR